MTLFPQRHVQHRGRGHDPPEDVRPQQDRERRADRAVGVALVLDLTGDPVDRDRVQGEQPDAEQCGPGDDVFPTASPDSAGSTI